MSALMNVLFSLQQHTGFRVSIFDVRNVVNPDLKSPIEVTYIDENPYPELLEFKVTRCHDMAIVNCV